MLLCVVLRPPVVARLHQRLIPVLVTRSLSDDVVVLNGGQSEVEDRIRRRGGPTELYDRRLQNGDLRPDGNQRVVVEHFQNLHDALARYTVRRPGALTVMKQKIADWRIKYAASGRRSAPRECFAVKMTDAPLGLYVFGGVGCGKTMLMDLFHETCLSHRKRRVHFHQFMLDIHRRIHKVKQSMAVEGFNLNRSQPYDPIAPVAKAISEETLLLCFDEYQVTDIADAMILKRLFSHLWKNGVVVVATSNRRPDDLYKNGLQRIHFLPFIPMLKANCKVVNIDSIDYRKLRTSLQGFTYFSAADCDAKYEMDKAYEELVSREVGEEGRQQIEVLGRTLTFEKTCGRIVDTTFDDLCNKPLGAVDYLEICRNFDVILIRDIPCISLEHRTSARRFITLIDMLYDNHIKVLFSAETQLSKLFLKGDMTEYDKHHERVLLGDLNIQAPDNHETASIFTGEEELFAFERVTSRMMEMNTAAYWNQKVVDYNEHDLQDEQ